MVVVRAERLARLHERLLDRLAPDRSSLLAVRPVVVVLLLLVLAWPLLRTLWRAKRSQ